MRITEPLGRRRRGALIALAVVLVMTGLVLAATAPAGPSSSNKVDAYGGPTPRRPDEPEDQGGVRRLLLGRQPGLRGARLPRDRDATTAR